MSIVGQVVHGYVVDRPLGQGAMGAVFQAHRVEDFEPVVLKFLAAELRHEAALRRRFRREGEALRGLPRHPHVVAVHAVYDEPPCLAMELVPGRSLRQVLREAGRLPPEQAARLCAQVAAGLGAVHARGLLHRDVKPDNVMVTPEGEAKLVDFGLVKDAFRTGLTEQDQLLGSAPYLAPECWEGPGATPAVDVFALGVTLYELLSGRQPFAGGDLDEVAQAMQAGDYPPLGELRAGVPAPLAWAVESMLAADPGRRPRDGAVCAEDLRRALRGEAPRVPRLEDSRGGVWPLLGRRRWILGSDPGCDVQVPGADARHAEVRDRGELQLVALRGAAPLAVDDRPLRAAHGLRDGEVLTLGEARLVFRGGGGDAPLELPAHLRDGARAWAPLAVVDALLETGDPRVLAAALEAALPDPCREQAQAELLARFGAPPAVAARARAARADRAERARRALVGPLGAGPEPETWLETWERARPSLPGQLGAEPAAGTRLCGEVGGRRAELEPAGGVILVGRDARCQLRLDDPGVARLHLSLLLLLRRWVARDEGRGAVGQGRRLMLLEPGRPLELGPARVVLQVAGPALLDAAAGQALAEAGEARVSGALREAWAVGAEAEAWGRRLFPGDAARAAWLSAAVRDRVAGWEPLLRRTLGAGDPATLRERARAQPVQVPVGGWSAPRG